MHACPKISLTKHLDTKKLLSDALPPIGMSTNTSSSSSHQRLLEQRSNFGSWVYSLIASHGKIEPIFPKWHPQLLCHSERHHAFASPAMGPIKLQFQLSPAKSVICLELKNSLVETFANQGLSNRDFVSQHFLSCYEYLAQTSLFTIIRISTRRGFSWSVQQLRDRCNTVCHG